MVQQNHRSPVPSCNFHIPSNKIRSKGGGLILYTSKQTMSAISNPNEHCLLSQTEKNPYVQTAFTGRLPTLDVNMAVSSLIVTHGGH